MTPKELALLAAKALDSKKGADIKVMEVTDLTSLADYFVICISPKHTGLIQITDITVFKSDLLQSSLSAPTV